MTDKGMTKALVAELQKLDKAAEEDARAARRKLVGKEVEVTEGKTVVVNDPEGATAHALLAIEGRLALVTVFVLAMVAQELDEDEEGATP